MKRYEYHKATEIPWVSQVPSHWSFIRNANILTLKHSVVGERFMQYDLLSLTTGGIKIKNADDSRGKVPASFEGYQEVLPGDMVFCLFDLDCSAVFSGKSEHHGMITSAYDVAVPNLSLVSSSYLDYWFRAVFSGRYYKIYSKSVRYTINWDIFKALKTPVPPRDEQDQIVRYLDWQVSKINRLIAAKREKIALFEELKTHQTTDAVLHGVKQYKKYIETQEFGRIPAHWQIYQNKRLFRERVEHSKMGDETLLSVSKHYGVKPSADLTEDEQFATIKPALSLAGYKVVHKNDLVMNIMRARNGSYGISAYNGIVSPAYCIYYVTKNCNVKYLHYFLRTPHVKSLFETYSSGIAEHRRRLYPEDFLRLASVLPPIEDQNEIVEYIEQSLVKYDEAIANLKRQIACLQDMKTRLISDVVTGQVDVRGIEVPEYELVDNVVAESEAEELEVE